jgi:hypothetical protein
MATIFETITELSSIVTAAITAGVADNIPARHIRTTLVRVSTGSYKEVLPIIVPAECCIMGDELRATNVQPRTIYNSANTLTSIDDFQYTYEGIKHIENVIGNIVTGTTVTPESGNTESQNQSWPYAETAVVAPGVKKLARSIRRKIDYGLGLKLESDLTPYYDMNDPEDGKLRDLNLLNKEFIQAEVVGYITDQYPKLKYSRTKCKQDVGFILDAIGYDLTYGGNWQTVKAGEAYWEGTNLQIASSEKTATLAAYGYLRDLVQTVGRNITVTPTYQNDKTQRSGIAGDTGASNRARDLINNIISIITNGSGTVAITYPSLSGTDALVLDQFDKAASNLPAIQEKTIDFINENFGSFKYRSSKCRRDLELIINDTSYDMALGTNYNAVFSGLAYQRPINAYNLAEQRIETVGAIRKARDELIETVTTDGSSAVGSSNAATRIRSAYNEIVDIINNGSGNADTLSFPSPVGVDQNRVDAKDNLIVNKEFIKAEIIAWIANQIVVNSGNPASIWYNFSYDSAKCERDVGFIVDAMCYDILYGGTHASTRIAQSYFTGTTAYPAGQAAQTAAAYDRLATVMFYVVQEDTGSWTKTTSEIQTTPGTPATATEGALIRDTQMQIIEDVITAGNLNSLPAIVFPSITWADAEYQTAFSNISSDTNDVIKTVTQYITDTYNNFKYNHAKCSRDLGIILQAAKYDTLLGTNFASINAGLSYLRAPSTKVLGEQKTATLAANEFARQQIVDVMDGVTAPAGINTTWEWVEDIIWSGSPEGGNRAVEDIEVWNAIRQLELNKEFIVEEVLNHVDNTFKDRVTGIDIDADTIEISDTSWMSVGMPIKFFNDEDAGDSTDAVVQANLLEEETYYVKNITSATTFQISDEQYGTTSVLTSYGENFVVQKAYEYNRTLCARDVREYIEGMKWDLQWPQDWKRNYSMTDVSLDANGTTTSTTLSTELYLPAFYRSSLAARYYVNSVIGSQEEDFYYLRNGTGLRLQTLDGLRGDLGPANAYGTSRPTAGAYASLDPGWGPNDQRAWITARSPYVQNCTTFGFAAIGQKIDGALHNGGNDSIVSNDFTQVISDGIGAWITNNGRAELVSVFTYYSHIGYLAEAGGRIRGTNGNNSYGTFGSVAEGVDPDETPVTAIVDNNKQYNAVVSNVFTDGADEILQIEYSHAGNDYTEATINIFGAGDSEELVQEDYRDEAVNNVRIIEIDDSTGNPDATAGGSGYLVVTNTAQTGTTSSITLAATDGNLSTAYPGMKLYITGGAGVGQFGIVDTYNSGSKLATIVKETDGTAGWDHVVPGTAIVAANSSSTYLIEPRAEFTAPTKTNSQETGASSTYSAMEFIETSAEYTGVGVTTQSDGTGATFDVIRNGEKYYVTTNAAGTGYTRLDTLTIVGSNLGGVDTTHDITITITAVNADTGAITAFDFTGLGRKGLFVNLPATGTAGQSSVDGSTWTANTLSTSASWTDLISGKVDDGTTTFTQSYAVAVGITGGAVVANYSLNGTTWTASNPSGISATSRAAGAFGQIDTAISRIVIISDNDQDVAYSDNGGQTYITTSSALPSTGYNDIAYGNGLFVAVKGGSQEMAYSEDGITWTTEATGMPNTNDWNRVVFGAGRFVAIASDSDTIAYSLDGSNWTGVATALVSTTVRDISYGQGMFVVTTDDTNQVNFSQDGVYWPSGGYTLSNTYTGGLNAIAFGNPDRNPIFVANQNDAGTNILKAKIGATTKGRAGVANEQVFEVRITDPGSGYGSTSPTLTITDPNNINDVLTTVRINDGVLAQPTFVSRGSGFITATAEVDAGTSNGFADFLQDGQFIAVRRLSATPVNGSNVVFDDLPDQVFKLVNTVSLVGLIDGDKTAFLQISPPMEIEDAVSDENPVTMRIRFSQTRLTGHDFLDIGTGNFADTNYPGVPVNEPVAANETVSSNGGRVFFTSTDQDGNFKVGDLFSIEQSTGVATLNAEAFNIAGLQELSLGEVTLGGNSASITEFSTDPFFTANSDTVVPTQRAIKAYIEAQIGGGGASLIVNSVTAGDVFINGTQITTVSGALINIKANVNFQGAVLGTPLAYNYFLR